MTTHHIKVHSCGVTVEVDTNTLTNSQYETVVEAGLAAILTNRITLDHSVDEALYAAERNLAALKVNKLAIDNGQLKAKP